MRDISRIRSKCRTADCLLGRIHLSAMNADTQGQG
jgi:hypothetical protein